MLIYVLMKEGKLESKIFICGGTGAVGYAIRERLTEMKMSYIVSSRNYTFPRVVGESCGHIKMDTNDDGAIEATIKELGPDVLFFLAGNNDNRNQNGGDVARENTLGALKVLEACRKERRKIRICMPSSTEVEKDSGNYSSGYAISKASIEELAQVYTKTTSLEVKTPRLPLLFGRADIKSKRLFPYLIAKIMKRERPIIRLDRREIINFGIAEEAGKDLVASTLDLGFHEGSLYSCEVGWLIDLVDKALTDSRQYVGDIHQLTSEEGVLYGLLTNIVWWYKEEVACGRLGLSKEGFIYHGTRVCE